MKKKPPVSLERLRELCEPDIAESANYPPAFAERFARREATRIRLSEDARPLLTRLRDGGLAVDSVDELCLAGRPLSESIVGILIEGITHCKEKKNVEWIVRSLVLSKERFDGRPLIDAMEKYNDPTLSFVIMSTLVAQYPHSIDDWWKKAEADIGLNELATNLGHKWGTECKGRSRRPQ